MTTEANKQLLRRWFEDVWNNKRAHAIDQMMAPKIRGYGLQNDPAGVMESSEIFKSFHAGLLQALPDIHISVEDVIAEDDRVAVRCRVIGTHLGAGLGIPASGNSVDFTGTVFARVEDGKLVEGWNNFDFQTMFQQRGMLASWSPERQPGTSGSWRI